MPPASICILQPLASKLTPSCPTERKKNQAVQQQAIQHPVRRQTAAPREGTVFRSRTARPLHSLRRRPPSHRRRPESAVWPIRPPRQDHRRRNQTAQPAGVKEPQQVRLRPSQSGQADRGLPRPEHAGRSLHDPEPGGIRPRLLAGPPGLPHPAGARGRRQLPAAGHTPAQS